MKILILKNTGRLKVGDKVDMMEQGTQAPQSSVDKMEYTAWVKMETGTWPLFRYEYKELPIETHPEEYL